MIDNGYERIKDRIGKEFSVRKLKTENRCGIMDVYLDDEETKEKATLLAREYDKNKDFIKNLTKKCYDFCDSAISKSYEISQHDLSKESNDKLLEFFKEYVDRFYDLIVAVYITFPGESFLTERVLQDLMNEFKSEQENKIQEYFGTLTVLPEESDMFLEQKDLFEIAILLKNRTLQDEITKKRIKNHSIKFGWMGLEGNSLLEVPWNDDYFIQKLKEIETPEEKLKSLLDNRRREIERYRNFTKGLNKTLVEDAETLQDFIFLRTYRITALKRSQLNIKPLLKEISKRFNITFEDLVWLKHEEIENLFFDKESRKKGYAVIRENDVIRLDKTIDEPEEAKAGEIIRGVAANNGRAEGVVKIICSAKEADKMKNGDILVTRMTAPDMIMAIEKAAAIVTDEGGFTSHAVIISRELGKPCIIATKIATKVLKDGDRVRVDAESGVVEKIN